MSVKLDVFTFFVLICQKKQAFFAIIRIGISIDKYIVITKNIKITI